MSPLVGYGSCHRAQILTIIIFQLEDFMLSKETKGYCDDLLNNCKPDSNEYWRLLQRCIIEYRYLKKEMQAVNAYDAIQSGVDLHSRIERFNGLKYLINKLIQA